MNKKVKQFLIGILEVMIVMLAAVGANRIIFIGFDIQELHVAWRILILVVLLFSLQYAINGIKTNWLERKRNV